MSLASLWLLSLTAASAAEPVGYTCCADRTVSAVMRAYLELQGAVAAGKKNAYRHVAQLGRELEDPGGLDPVDVAVFRDLTLLVNKLHKADLDDIRADFVDISRNVIFLSLRHEGGDLTVAEAWCPGRGAWLQTDLDELDDPWGVGCGEWRR